MQSEKRVYEELKRWLENEKIYNDYNNAKSTLKDLTTSMIAFEKYYTYDYSVKIKC
jgi:hypothetical protein